MESERAEAVRHHYAIASKAWAAGVPPPDEAWEAFADDCDYDPVPNYPEARHIRGLASLRAFVADFIASWGRIEVELLGLEEHGDAVIARIMLRPEDTGTRPPLAGRVFNVYTFGGERIVRQQDFLTSAEARAAASSPRGD